MKRPAIPVLLSLLLVLALAGGAALWLVRSRSVSAPAAEEARPALTVSTVRPRVEQWPIRLAANGDIQAWQEASIGSEVGGLRLVAVKVNVGDRVRAGQVLAEFATETLQAELAQARAALKEAEASAAEADSNAARGRSLQASGAMSVQQVNQYQTAAQTARTRVDAARAALELQQARLKQTRILAPDHGVISARGATLGAVVAPGTELFRLIRQGRLEWRAEVTSSELAKLAPGTPVALTAASGARLNGKLRMIGPTVNPQNRSALVYVDLAPARDERAQALAGMFAQGEFELGKAPALVVPQQALVVRDGFSYLFRIDDGQRVTQIKVKAGRRQQELVEILEGLQPDAVLVASGAGFLNDGDRVRVVTAGTAQSAQR